MAERLKEKGYISKNLENKLSTHHMKKLMDITLDRFKKKLDLMTQLDKEIKEYMAFLEPLEKTAEEILEKHKIKLE